MTINSKLEFPTNDSFREQTLFNSKCLYEQTLDAIVKQQLVADYEAGPNSPADQSLLPANFVN